MSEMYEMKDYELHLLRLIPVGANNAITTKTLESKMKKDARDIRRIVRGLVMKYNIPIIGTRYGEGGYYIPKTIKEQQEGVKPLLEQAMKEMERVSTLEKSDIHEYKKYLGEMKNDKQRCISRKNYKGYRVESYANG
jgi:hypothetical protein|nr:MAG TPA: hypothetical protein [Caudoviricetes sp.]